MKTRNIFFFFAIAASLCTVSCTKDFLWRNTNHEQAYEDELKHDGLAIGGPFAQMTKNVNAAYQLGTSEYGSDRYQVIQDLAGNIFSGYTGATNSGFNGNNRYNITNVGWYETMFNDVFNRLVTQVVVLEPHREGNEVNMAVVDLVKVAAMHRLTDTYGPIPYSSILTTTLERPYDSQEKVYHQMFDELDRAIDILTEAAQTGTTSVLSLYDEIFYGDITKWIRFGNTLRLRLAMHVVYADEALAYAEAEKSLGNLYGLMAGAGDIAQVSGGSSAWQYPLYTIQYDFNDGDSAIGATIETYMNAYEDPRREKLFTKVSGGAREYIGVRNGITNGSDYKLKVSRVNCTKADPLVWMFPAEASFLAAEYWLRKGDEAQAKSFYEAGVKLAFETVGATGVDAYLASTATVGGYEDPIAGNNSYANALTSTPVSWDAASGFEAHLEQIITQKYFAMFPEGQEAWTEFRRTGYPKVIPVQTNNSGGTINTNLQIRRLPFPSSEYRTNAKNVAEAVTLLAGEAKSGSADNGGTRLWWDKNPRF